MKRNLAADWVGLALPELRKDSLSSANPCPKTGRVNSRTFHLNFQKNGLDNGVHLIEIAEIRAIRKTSPIDFDPIPKKLPISEK